MASVVPVPSIDAHPMTPGSITSEDAAPKLASKKAMKLPFCAYYVAMRRVNNFTTIALIAAIVTIALAGTKYWLARKSETDAAKDALASTAESVTRAMKLKIEFDLSTLDSVANLWHLDSKMSREAFRQYVLSEYFGPSLSNMETIMLVHRIRAHQRAALENDPAAVQVRRDCCSGTKYDIPSKGWFCRARARNQCRIAGPDRYYFTQKHEYEDGSQAVLPASSNSSEFLVVTYQEPLEKHPGPLGFDMSSCSSSREGFWEADRTGTKGVTKRLARVFSMVPEFGLQVWNNVFVDRQTYGGRTILEGVNLTKRHKVADAGGDPYSMGSVVAIYKLQELLRSIVEGVFGRDLRWTKIYLFDDRDDTPVRERLLAIYDTDSTRSAAGVNQEVMDDQNKILDEIVASSEYYELNTFEVADTGARFKLAIVPHEAFLEKHITVKPLVILAISLAVIVAAQVERWLGHPYIVSEFTLTRAKVERELREGLEKRIIKNAAKVSKKVSKKVWQDLGKQEAPEELC